MDGSFQKAEAFCFAVSLIGTIYSSLAHVRKSEHTRCGDIFLNGTGYSIRFKNKTFVSWKTLHNNNVLLTDVLTQLLTLLHTHRLTDPHTHSSTDSHTHTHPHSLKHSLYILHSYTFPFWGSGCGRIEMERSWRGACFISIRLVYSSL